MNEKSYTIPFALMFGMVVLTLATAFMSKSNLDIRSRAGTIYPTATPRVVIIPTTYPTPVPWEPDVVIARNYATINKYVSCDTVCSNVSQEVGYRCVSVGTDNNATNGSVWNWQQSLKCYQESGYTCQTGITYIKNAKSLCDGARAQWTNCRCETIF